VSKSSTKSQGEIRPKWQNQNDFQEWTKKRPQNIRAYTLSEMRLSEMDKTTSPAKNSS